MCQIGVCTLNVTLHKASADWLTKIPGVFFRYSRLGFLFYPEDSGMVVVTLLALMYLTFATALCTWSGKNKKESELFACCWHRLLFVYVQVQRCCIFKHPSTSLVLLLALRSKVYPMFCQENSEENLLRRRRYFKSHSNPATGNRWDNILKTTLFR